jgi:hypothetical protein
VSRPALALLRGDADRSEVTLGQAHTAIDYWERTWIDAAGDLGVATTDAEIQAARRRADVASYRLDRALDRRDRLVCELQGLRWLWLAGSNADG